MTTQPAPAADTLAELVQFLARSLVDRPDDVQVRSSNSRDGVVLELRVAQSDLGKVIGKQGATARALRTVLFAAAARQRRRAVLNIVEE